MRDGGAAAGGSAATRRISNASGGSSRPHSARSSAELTATPGGSMLTVPLLSRVAGGRGAGVRGRYAAAGDASLSSSDDDEDEEQQEIGPAHGDIETGAAGGEVS